MISAAEEKAKHSLFSYNSVAKQGQRIEIKMNVQDTYTAHNVLPSMYSVHARLAACATTIRVLTILAALVQ